VNLTGDIQIISDRLKLSNSYIETTSPETGFCGVGGVNGGLPSGSDIAGVGVNFKTNKTYIPSSVSLTKSVGNANSVYVIDINKNGFWLYITCGSADGYYLWRGDYNA